MSSLLSWMQYGLKSVYICGVYLDANILLGLGIHRKFLIIYDQVFYLVMIWLKTIIRYLIY